MVIKDETTTQRDITLKPEQSQTPTYTQEQVDKMVRDAKSSVLADAGRAKKSAEVALARLNQLEAARLEAELEAAKDDPEALRRLRAEQRAKELESELAEAGPKLSRLAELEAREAEAGKAKLVTEIATRFKVDPERLKKVVKFTDGTPEAIEEIAKDLPKLSPNLKPDSGRMQGGDLTFEQLRAEFIKDPRGPYREAYMEARRGRK